MIPERVLSLRKKVVNMRIAFFLLLFLTLQVFAYLNNNRIIAIPNAFIKSVEVAMFAFAILLMVSLVVRFTGSKVYTAFENEVSLEQRIFLSKVYSFSLYTLGVGAILWKSGFSMSHITIFLGLATTGIAFAIRDVLMSIFAWLVVLKKKPFRIHDNIKIGEEIGEVMRIGTFYLTIQPNENTGSTIKVPNKILLEKPIINYGKKQKHFLFKIPITKLPNNFDNKFKKIGNLIESIKENKNEAVIKIESDGNNWFILIEFVSKNLTTEIHNKIIAFTYDLFKDSMKKK